MRLAAAIGCDMRTLKKELDTPGAVRSIVGDRIRAHIAAESKAAK